MASLHYYKLDEQGRPQREEDPVRWARWAETAITLISKTSVGEVVIETTFKGFSDKQPPEIWQCEIRGSQLDGTTSLCPGTREDAIVMHETMVHRVQDFLSRHNGNNH